MDDNKKPSWTMEWTLVGPKLAEEYLDKSRGNRDESKAQIESFSDQMLTGDWRATHQSIIAFDEDDVLRDGHHRLYAIVRSDTYQWFLVARGVPSETFEAVDCGKIRNLCDRLVLAGGDDAANPYLRKAVYRSLELMEDGRTKKESMAHFRSLKARFPCVALFEQARGSLNVKVRLPGKTKLMSAPSLAAVVWAHEVFPAEVGELLDALAVEDASVPLARLLRDLDVSGNMSASKDRYARTMRVLRVLHAHVLGEELTKMPPVTDKGYEAIKVERERVSSAVLGIKHDETHAIDEAAE